MDERSPQPLEAKHRCPRDAFDRNQVSTRRIRISHNRQLTSMRA
jgi:hypothetical protein